ncbi:hypothetical protein B0H19DRAFT_1141785 [Mycena capillaripes]|nr:hypothetical protein B0H19DRAFT_1141785 [Mycena capillaripes]
MQGHSIHLLFRFANLTFVLLKSPGAFDFDNAFVSSLTQAWPLVETLHLLTAFPLRKPKATLACIRYFTRCRHLQTLEITVDCSVPVPATDLTRADSGSLRLTNHLTALNVGFSPISTPTLPVVRFIADIFPHLQRIESVWDIGDTDNYYLYDQARKFHPRWTEVSREIHKRVRDGV